jgi:hypothetical protein
MYVDRRGRERRRKIRKKNWANRRGRERRRRKKKKKRWSCMQAGYIYVQEREGEREEEEKRGKKLGR